MEARAKLRHDGTSLDASPERQGRLNGYSMGRAYLAGLFDYASAARYHRRRRTTPAAKGSFRRRSTRE